MKRSPKLKRRSTRLAFIGLDLVMLVLGFLEYEHWISVNWTVTENQSSVILTHLANKIATVTPRDTNRRRCFRIYARSNVGPLQGLDQRWNCFIYSSLLQSAANNGSVKPDIWNPCFWSSRWNHPSSNSIILLDLIINVVELYIFLLYYGYYYPFSDILSQFIRWLLYLFSDN